VDFATKQPLRLVHRVYLLSTWWRQYSWRLERWRCQSAMPALQ